MATKLPKHVWVVIDEDGEPWAFPTRSSAVEFGYHEGNAVPHKYVLAEPKKRKPGGTA